MMLLQTRYARINPHSLQMVPDAHQGDLGMEAFSHDGVAYQCYAAQEPLGVAECYEKQRDKLSRDLGKLKKKSEDVGKLLGKVELHRYVFLVHRLDSRHLVAHAQTKASEVSSWGLPFIKSSSFSIVVETLDDYRAEQNSIHSVPSALVDTEAVSPSGLATWADANGDLVDTARNKLAKVEPSTSVQEAVIGSLMDQYLNGDNALERLRTTAPDVYQAILKARSHKEGLLVLQHPPSATQSTATLAGIATELTSELKETAAIDTMLAEKLAWASVADWLMRCPLDFGAAS